MIAIYVYVDNVRIADVAKLSDAIQREMSTPTITQVREAVDGYVQLNYLSLEYLDEPLSVWRLNLRDVVWNTLGYFTPIRIAAPADAVEFDHVEIFDDEGEHDALVISQQPRLHLVGGK